MDEKKEIPKLIYKYEDFNIHSLENLKAQSLYFGSPLKFNDPYDCATTPNILPPSDSEIPQIRKLYLSNPQLPPDIKAEFQTSSDRDLGQIILQSSRNTCDIVIDKFCKNNGVTCFSESNDDLLMWSHYGGRYKGFCLEFSTEHSPFNTIKKVNYSPDQPQISSSSMERAAHEISAADETFLKMFCTKSISWSYEKEWRLFHKEADSLYGYPSDSLTGVYMGPEIGPRSLEIICLILKNQNLTVKFWRGKRSTTKFKIEFEPFEYTPYLEAARLGLKE